MKRHIGMFTAVLLGGSAMMLSGCGYTAVDAEATGQAKKLSNVTPLVCADYKAFDMSLGVMRNGTGSMSTQDMWFTVVSNDPKVIETLKNAVEHNLIVRVRYNVRRWAICTEADVLTSAEIVKE